MRFDCDASVDVCSSDRIIRHTTFGCEWISAVYSADLIVFFFFSSRRRHTRFDCDWSSDVCSSDLAVNVIFRREIDRAEDRPAKRGELVSDYSERFANPYVAAERGYLDDVIEIGRASCRERG